MDIITQDLINETQKIIKDCFFTVIKEYIRPIITTSLNSVSPQIYVKTMLELKDSLNKVVIQTLKLAIPKIDTYFNNSTYRKMYFYRNAPRSRNLSLIFGELSFEKMYYTDKTKKNGFFLIDELFNFEKYTYYDPIVRSVLINDSVRNNANQTSENTSFVLGDYQAYLTGNSFNNVPRQTIYRWIKDWDLPKVEYDLIENINELYVMVDEKWLHEQIRLSTLSEEEKAKRHYIMSKCFITFTNKEEKNGRGILNNRHVFMTTSDKPWMEFANEIYNIYNFEKIKNIYLLSDAGSWILANRNEIKFFKNNNIIVNTCEFHAKEYCYRMTRSKEKRALLIKYIYEDKDKNAFIKLADEIIENSNNKEYKTKQKNYIVNHWKTIINMTEREVKSSMESHISHCIANRFGSRPKGFSKKRIEKYIKLEEYKQNNVNIMDLYLKSYNKNVEDNFIYNATDVSYSIFEKDTSIVPTMCSSNPLSLLFNNIAYGV